MENEAAVNIPAEPDSKMTNTPKNNGGARIYRKIAKKKLLVLCLLFIGTLAGFLLNLVVGSSDLSIGDAVAVLAGGEGTSHATSTDGPR